MPELIRDRYETLEVLGRGQTTEVVHARDHQHDRTVALKMHRIDAGADRARLLREGRTFLGLTPHPAIPTVREDFFLDDHYVLVMDWVEGTPLAQVVATRGDPGLPLTTVLAWLPTVADAIDHLHGHSPSVVHGDVRPENILIGDDRGIALVFGTAPLGGALGEPRGFVAPEVAAGEPATPSADVYALAATTVVLLTGSEPEPDTAISWEGVTPELARRLDRVVRRALDPDPTRRPSSAGDFVDRLRNAQEAALPTGVVTFVLTDIEGSTPLWESHPDVMAEVVARHTEIAAEMAESYGGQLPRSQGEGDSTLSAFARATDAAAAALAFQAAIAAEPWPDEIALRVRAGLHTGEAQMQHGDYVGAAVSRTARLRGMARGGQVLVSQATAELVADRLPLGATLVDLGRFELRGLDRAEEVYELCPGGDSDSGRTEELVAPEQGPDATRSRLEFPGALRDSATRFVGRGPELAVLNEAWRRVVERGDGRVAFLAGDPGIGKSRLSTEIARQVYAEGATVLFGRCYEENVVAYQPFVEALGRYLRSGSAAEVRGDLVRSGTILTRLVPDAAMRFADLPAPIHAEPDTERYLMFEAAHVLLAGLAKRAPVLLVLDDLQWADRPTLALLLHLARNLESSAILVLGTYRSGEVVGDHPLLATITELRRAEMTDEVMLTGLDDEAVGALVADIVHKSPDAAFVRSARRETEGNPFFIQEICSHIAGADFTGEFTLDGLGVPEGVKQVIGRRVAQLDDATERLLTSASVIGRVFKLEVLLEMTNIDEDDALDLLDTACAARVLEEVGGSVGLYSFVHALTRETLYDSISATRRARLHRRVAEAIEACCENALADQFAVLAFHYAAAGTEREKAVEYARRAGDHALDQLAHEEAALQYERGLALLSEREMTRCDLLLGLAEARRRAGDVPGAQEAFLEAGNLARAEGDAERLARAAIGNFRGHVLAQPSWHGPVIEQLEAALAMLPEEDSALRSRVLAALSLELYFLFEDSPELQARRWGAGAQAVGIARRIGDDAALAFALACRHTAIFDPDHLRDRLATATELIEVCGRTGNLELELIGHVHRACDLLELTRVDEARHEAELGARLAEELKRPMQRYFVVLLQAVLASLDGRFDESEALADEALNIGLTGGHPDSMVVYATQSAVFGWQHGDTSHLVEAAEQLLEEFADLPAWRAAVALVMAMGGRVDAARAQARFFSDNPAGLDRKSIMTAALCALGEVARILDDHEVATLVYDRLSPYAGLLCVASINVTEMGPISRALGVLATVIGDYDAAERHFTDALETSERIAAPAHAARTKADHARMLLARRGDGDVEVARRFLLEARPVADSLGMHGVVTDLDSLSREL